MVAAASGFGDTAVGPELQPLLASHEIAMLSDQFRRKDKQAEDAQRSLIRLLSWTNVIVLLIALLSGAVVALSVFDASLPSWAGPASRSLAGCLILLTAAATVLGQFARDEDRLERWRRLRADAELARSGRFVAAAKMAAASGKTTALEGLNLVRAGLIVEQRDWYVRRAARHRAHRRLTSLFAGFALLLTGLASAAALSVTLTLSGVNNAVLLIGVFAAAFSAYATDRENLYRDRVNAVLYEGTAERLDVLMAQFDKVRSEIEADNPNAVVAFTQLVADELQTEHKQWTAGLDVTSQLLAQLDQRIKQARGAGDQLVAVAKDGPRFQPEADGLGQTTRASGAPAAKASGELAEIDAAIGQRR